MEENLGGSANTGLRNVLRGARVVASSSNGRRPTWEGQIATGSALIDERSGRVDLYDTKSNRTGYGTIDKNGRIDLFDTEGNRTGSGQVAPGSTRPGGRR
jgi:hypothetical protein